MRFENFEINSSIELQSGNTCWDLHNVAEFLGLELLTTENGAVMKWNLPPESNRSDGNMFFGMELRFKNLQFLHIGARDSELPLTEDSCVWYILKVDPAVDGKDPYMRTRRDWTATDSFRLVFRFQSDRAIEIESETVELVSVP